MPVGEGSGEQVDRRRPRGPPRRRFRRFRRGPPRRADEEVKTPFFKVIVSL